MKHYLFLLMFGLIILKAPAQTNKVNATGKSFYASIAGHTDGDISLKELFDTDGLTLKNVSDTDSKIIHFHLVIYCKGRDPFDAESNSSLFTSNMKGAFKSFAFDGCKGYIDEIRCTNNKDTLELTDIAFSLTK